LTEVGSCLVFRGEARYRWKHRLKAKDGKGCFATSKGVNDISKCD
jgi:hypothetical protein